MFNIVAAGSGEAMNLVEAMPDRPTFLADIRPQEVTPAEPQTLTFKTERPATGQSQHPIKVNNEQFTKIPTHSPGMADRQRNSRPAHRSFVPHPHQPIPGDRGVDPNAPLLGETGLPVKNAGGN
jgi:hypothetical protein